MINSTPRTITNATTTLHSSQRLGWDDISIAHIQLESGEYQLPPLSQHRICLILNPVLHLEQARNGRTFVHEFVRGQAQLLPIGTTGFWRSRQPMQTLNIEFTSNFMQSVAEKIIRADSVQLEMSDEFFVHDPHIEHISMALLTELIDGGHNGRLYSSSLATALAAHLVQKYASNSAAVLAQPTSLARRTFKQVLDYIESHLAHDLDLPTLAQIVNISTNHFAVLFKQEMNISPYQYIVQRRVHRARELILTSHLTLAQIAAEVGFYDQSHLTRHMRRLLGVTPATLQRR